MLVLTRRTGQKIVIGNEVIVDVLGVSGEGVRLGISAPSTTSVHRHEVFIEIGEANRAAEVDLEQMNVAAIANLSEVVRAKRNDEEI